MSSRQAYSPPSHDRKPVPAVPEGTLGQIGYRAGQAGDRGAIQTLLQQIAQSLAVLSGASEVLLGGKATGLNGQALRVWLQPNARQAEAAMHKLRGMRPTLSPALTELSQCLTVLVLAADMLVQGQLSSTDALAFYELLRRNADGAIRSLNELRALFGLEA